MPPKPRTHPTPTFLSKCCGRSVRQARRVRSASTPARTAGFPAIKTLEDYDFSFATGAPKAQIHELASLGFVERTENVVMLGPSATRERQNLAGLGLGEKAGRAGTVVSSRGRRLFADPELAQGEGCFPRLFRSLIQARIR